MNDEYTIEKIGGGVLSSHEKNDLLRMLREGWDDYQNGWVRYKFVSKHGDEYTVSKSTKRNRIQGGQCWRHSEFDFRVIRSEIAS